MWRVIVRIEVLDDLSSSSGIKWISGMDLPTFYLDGDELGIVDAAHAEKYVVGIVDAMEFINGNDRMKLHITVAKL